MSSGKPQTRGLAALLRIEKERRARQEMGADESANNMAEGGLDQPSADAALSSDRAEQSATETPAVVSGTVAAAEPWRSETVTDEAGPPSISAQQPHAAPAASTPTQGIVQRLPATEHATTPVTSLPRKGRAPARPKHARRKKSSSRFEPSVGADPGWERFAADWKPFLRAGVKFTLCEFFYRNTVALGKREIATSTAQLSRVSGAHRRHIFLVLSQLEELRFIQKESLSSNRKDEGLLIRFFPNRDA